MDATQRIKDLIAVTARFVEVLTAENDALRKKRMEEIAALVDNKAAVSRAYESLVGGLADRPDAVRAVAAELRRHLSGLGGTLEKLMDENARLLTAAIDVNRRVLQIAAEAVKANQPGPKTYSARGALGVRRGNASRSVPMSLDRTL